MLFLWLLQRDLKYFCTCTLGVQLTSQLLSDLKRASAVNKAYRLSGFSASEEELLRTLEAARNETAQGNAGVVQQENSVVF